MYLRCIVIAIVAVLTRFTESVPLIENLEEYSNFEKFHKDIIESFGIDGNFANFSKFRYNFDLNFF